MSEIKATRLAEDDLRKGYTLCDCGKVAFVFDSRLLRRLPPDYHGETCPECGMHGVAIGFLEPTSEEGASG